MGFFASIGKFISVVWSLLWSMRKPRTKKGKKPTYEFKTEGLFTAHVGPVGSGKTYSMVAEAVKALSLGEPVFTNVNLDLSKFPELGEVSVYQSVKDFAGHRGPAVIRWTKPTELLDPEVRCGKILFDELGALVNNRESDIFPFGLTVKLIHLRKYHLSVEASVQDDEMADKNIRRFYNRIWFLSEWHIPFAALLRPSAARPVLPCKLTGCTKTGAHLTHGDNPGKFPYAATVYRRYDVHPKYTQNKEKHESRGYQWLWFDDRIANCYQSAASVEADAVAAHKEAEREAAAHEAARRFGRR